MVLISTHNPETHLRLTYTTALSVFTPTRGEEKKACQASEMAPQAQALSANPEDLT